MKTEFIYNDEIIATVDLEEPLYENSTVVAIFGKEYIVFENHHEVEINADGSYEKMVCAVVSEEEYEEWETINC